MHGKSLATGGQRRTTGSRNKSLHNYELDTENGSTMMRMVTAIRPTGRLEERPWKRDRSRGVFRREGEFV